MDGPTEAQKRVFGEGVTREMLEQYLAPHDESDTDSFSSEIDSSFENDVYISDAQQQWEENMKQLEVAVFYVLCPVVGRLIGRKAAHSLWIRFVTWRWKSATDNNLIEQLAATLTKKID